MNVEEIVERQKSYFLSGTTRAYEFRLNALKTLEKALKENSGDIYTALEKDLNKHRTETLMTELGMVLGEISYMKKHLRSLMRVRGVKTPVSLFPSKSKIYPEPYGCVLIMSPWNYPVNLCLSPLVGAIAAGNCAVVKPSAYANESSRVISRILSNAFKPDYIAVIEGGREENRQLLEQRFDYIFFTGSPAVGREVMQAAAKNLIPVSLELGGKSPVIVDKSADLAKAAEKIAFGKILNAGQTCVEPDYLLIDRSLKDSFYDEYRKAILKFFPDGDMSEMPVIINKKHYDRLMGLLEGEKVIIGGDYDEEKRFIGPTVLDEVGVDSPIMQQEIFGPILPVLCFDNLSECIDYLHSCPKPLALYMFSNDKKNIDRVFDSCSFGGGCINDVIVHVSSPYLPFGGVGNSGMGRYHGRESFNTFTHMRSVVVTSKRFTSFVQLHPYTKLKHFLLKMVLK